MDVQPGMPTHPETPPGPPSAPADAVDEETQVQRAADQLLQFMQTDPTTRPHIDRIIRHHLENGIDLETWGHVLNGLTVYVGEDIATFLLTLLLRSDDAEFVDLVEKYVGAEMPYLRSLMALYSDDLREAHTVFGEKPHGWKTVNRRIYYDHLTQLWHATFEIVKYGGERVYLDETPNSAIVLCQAIIDALNAVPVETAQQAADPRAVEDLVALFYTFVEHFAPELFEDEE